MRLLRPPYRPDMIMVWHLLLLTQLTRAARPILHECPFRAPTSTATQDTVMVWSLSLLMQLTRPARPILHECPCRDAYFHHHTQDTIMPMQLTRAAQPILHRALPQRPCRTLTLATLAIMVRSLLLLAQLTLARPAGSTLLPIMHGVIEEPPDLFTEAGMTGSEVTM